VDLECYKVVFDFFDRDKSGHIDRTDLDQIVSGMQRDPARGMIKFLHSLETEILNSMNHDGKITFEEFVSFLHELQSNLEDRPADIGLLGKGVTFHPDPKILEFLSYSSLSYFSQTA